MTDNTSDWLYKQVPSTAAPLTRAWYKAVTTPRFDIHGTAYYVLTPPADDHPLGEMIGNIFVGGTLLAIAMFIVWATVPLWMK